MTKRMVQSTLCNFISSASCWLATRLNFRLVGSFVMYSIVQCAVYGNVHYTGIDPCLRIAFEM